MELNMKDIQITSFTNGYDFSCRVLHMPTGIYAECDEFIGTFRNERKALAMLKEKLNDFETRSKDT